MCFSAAASSENDHGNMNLASNTASGAFDDPVQGRRHPADDWVADPASDVFDHLAGHTLVPLSIRWPDREAELDEDGVVSQF
jgi:hypothetical protein